MMEAWFTPLEHGHWWLLAVVLLILEVTTPAFFFLWLGIAAAVTGGVVWGMPSLDWKTQALLFSGLALVSLGAWRFFHRRHPTVTALPTLNRRGHQYMGRVLVVSEPIVNGLGRVRVDDTMWKVAGRDAPAGTRVRVVAVQDAVLQVETVET